MPPVLTKSFNLPGRLFSRGPDSMGVPVKKWSLLEVNVNKFLKEDRDSMLPNYSL